MERILICEELCYLPWWSSDKILATYAGVLGSNPGCEVSFMITSLGFFHNDFGNIYMKFGNEFWLILFREYIIPKLFAVSNK